MLPKRLENSKLVYKLKEAFVRNDESGTAFDFDELWKTVLNTAPVDGKSVPGAFVGWDNSPRKKEQASSSERHARTNLKNTWMPRSGGQETSTTRTCSFSTHGTSGRRAAIWNPTGSTCMVFWRPSGVPEGNRRVACAIGRKRPLSGGNEEGPL